MSEENKGQVRDKQERNNGSYDIFRDSPLRYAGYANEVGESFRYQLPRMVRPSYAVAFGYCFADAATTAYGTWQKYPSEVKDSQYSREAKASLDSGDVLLWQSLASVIIPGAAINILVKASRFAVARSPVILAPAIKEWLPTAVGLGSIPFIIHPIDHAVDVMLDNTTRKWISQNPTTRG
jgi:mitochondrial fission process protein 1